MATTIVIVTGYDNPLTQTNVSIIKNLKKFDKGEQYEWRLLHYIPNITAICFMVREMSIIEQDYRDNAKRTLKDLSQELGILLPMKGGAINYAQAIESGSTAITYAIAAMNTACIILTSHPDNIKFDRFDGVMHWVKTTQVGQYLSGKFAHRLNNAFSILTPEQFIARSSRGQRHDSDSACKRESQEISHTKAHFTPLWQKTPGATVSFER